MARNGSGTYVPPASSWNPAVDGQTMGTSDWTALLADIATALTNSVAVDGQTTTTARIPFSQGVSVAGGSVGAPGVGLVADATSGLYGGSGMIGLSANGVSVLSSTDSTTTLPLAVTVTGALTGNGGVSTTTLATSGAATVSGLLTAAGAAKVAGVGSALGFFGATGAVKQTVTGSKGANAALTSLIAAMVAHGLITDGSS